MWIPNTATEIEAAARAGELVETRSFDAKADLPTAKRNATLAVDVAAMTAEGGVILYGVGEDADGRPTQTHPLPLSGVRERIDQIVQTSLLEVPTFEVKTFPTAEDPAVGYVMVIIPPSQRAPHQVIVNHEHRFYGRGATGNRMLGEGDIARLYERRRTWTQDRNALLEAAIASSPVSPEEEVGYVHAFARPVITDENLWDTADAAAPSPGLMQRLHAAASQQWTRPFDPNFRSAQWSPIGADGFRLSTRFDATDLQHPRRLLEIKITPPGTAQLFCGRAVVPDIGGPMPRPPQGRRVILEDIIGGSVAGFLALAASLYKFAGYHGQVDAGVAVTRLAGGFSSRDDWRERPYNGADYRTTTAVTAAELLDPVEVAERLLGRLLRATTGMANPKVFF